MNQEDQADFLRLAHENLKAAASIINKKLSEKYEEDLDEVAAQINLAGILFYRAFKGKD